MLATVIARELPEPDTAANLGVYRDLAAMDEAFVPAVRRVIAHRIMTGVRENEFRPKGYATRAQAAVVMLRMLQALGWIDGNN